jgi:hypothetical protein
MNFAGALLVAARGGALPVSCRVIGSANGNRKRQLPFQPIASRVTPLVFNVCYTPHCIPFHSVTAFCDDDVTSGNSGRLKLMPLRRRLHPPPWRRATGVPAKGSDLVPTQTD